MQRISILSILLLVFSCKQFGAVKSFTEIDSGFGDDDSLVVSDGLAKSTNDDVTQVPTLTSQEAEMLGALKSFLKDAMEVNGKEENLKAEYDKSYKEFFDWLSKDVNKQKEFVNSFNNICEIVTRAVDACKKRSHEQQSLGLNEYVCYKIKKSKGEALSLFFQKVADAFGTEEYKNKNEESQKPEKCNQEIFKVIKRLFTESESNKELENLKNFGKV
ncbi:hypothetical protein OY14_04535 (plasmid) [Borreliella chilensis]|uniref:Lipoprotein n=1 Tax=Borreliella chilensis TaxID=1245910 RepID=A0A0A7UWS5_9SPIR|nr:hypothetical protein OY14_04535 [Borreliella chilensis]